jgi:SAM-dependent methyltransferase
VERRGVIALAHVNGEPGLSPGSLFNRPRVLHVGCGTSRLPEAFGPVYETRLDLNPAVKPDIVADMTELGDIGPYSAIWCSHALEHLTPAEGHKALCEFRRVLNDGGYAIILVPNIEGILPTDDVLYVSDVGPINGHDLIYGYSGFIEAGIPHYLHKTGFIRRTLRAALERAGFRDVRVEIPEHKHSLLGIGIK